ncbi:hypothetical protein H1R20_g16536, partial [Candolleomyces eurysporus]
MLKKQQLVDLIERQPDVRFPYVDKGPMQCTCKELIGILVRRLNGYYPAPPAQVIPERTRLSVSGLDGNINGEEVNLSMPMEDVRGKGVGFPAACEDKGAVVSEETEDEAAALEESGDEVAIPEGSKDETAVPEERKDEVALPEELVENHVDFHSSATVKVLNVLEKMSQQDCEKCQALFEPLAYQELLASLRVAQYVKSLETIGWETWCDYSNRTHYGGQRRPVDDQLEGALEGSHTVIRVNSKASRAEELEGGSQDLAMEVEDDAGSSQASDASSVSQSSSTMDSDSQVSIAPYLNGDKGGRPGIPRAGFRLNMKVIREAQRVRIQRLEPNLNQ